MANGFVKRERTARTMRHGFALLISMGILGLLAILGTTFVLMSRMESSTSTSYVDKVRARMIAFSGMEAAMGFLAGYDRNQPWSGQFWNGVFPTTNIGQNGLLAIGDGGSDDWLYGELFKVYGGVYNATTRPYGQAIPQLGRQVIVTGPGGYVVPAATAVAFQRGVATNYDGFTMGYSSDPNVLRGTYESSPTNPGDFYIVKIVDGAGRININDTNRRDASGPKGRLANMLNTLGGELKPIIVGLGDSIMTARGANDPLFAPTLPIKDESDLRTRLAAALGLPTAERMVDQTRDYISYQAWADPNVLKAPFIGAVPAVQITDPVESRCPINMNTAPKEVLVAVLNGVSATYAQRNPVSNAPTMTTVTLSIAEARALADHVIACRYFYGGNPAFPIGYPHVDWMHVFQDTFDTFTGFSGGPAVALAKKDLCKAAFCPNTTIKKWNPDVILVDPDVSGRTDFTLLDKTDMRVITTEFCYGSMGYYDIEVVGQIWDKNARTVAAHTLRSTVKMFDVLRLTTQEQFEKYRVFDPAKEPNCTPSPPYNAGSRFVSIVTHPEFPHDKNYPISVGAAPWPGSAVKPARYDGQLLLNGWVDHRTTTNSFLVPFNDAKFDGVRGLGNLLNQDPMRPVTNGMLPASITSWTNFYNSQLHPFGVYFDKQYLSGQRLRYAEGNLPNGGEGTIEFWIKPAIDLLGAGFDNQTFNMLGNPCRVDNHYVLARMRNRQVQVVLAKPENSFGTFTFVPFSPFFIFIPPNPGATITLTSPITNGTGPKEWLPHTWHHLEFNWSETSATAQLYLDGDLSDSKPLPVDFFPFEPGMPPSEPWTPGGQCGFIVGNAMSPDGNHDPDFNPNFGVIGTMDNVCAHDKVLHAASFPSRSRYHDVTFSTYNWAVDTDTSGNHGLYRRLLQEIKDKVTSQGPATMLTMSCTHYHPPHEHSSGDHNPGGVISTGIALGHVSLALERAGTQYKFYYDNCAGVAAIDPATSKGLLISSGQELALVVKMEMAENSQIPHNIGPIVDDITITYTHGPRMLSFLQPTD